MQDFSRYTYRQHLGRGQRHLLVLAVGANGKGASDLVTLRYLAQDLARHCNVAVWPARSWWQATIGSHVHHAALDARIEHGIAGGALDHDTGSREVLYLGLALVRRHELEPDLKVL